MTFPADLLGRPPIMRHPCERKSTEMTLNRAPAKRACQVRVIVPYTTTSSTPGFGNPVTLPATPWEDKG